MQSGVVAVGGAEPTSYSALARARGLPLLVLQRSKTGPRLLLFGPCGVGTIRSIGPMGSCSARRCSPRLGCCCTPLLHLFPDPGSARRTIATVQSGRD
ncbi:hypothetical protein NDU88_002820 [Pleurodeles waltl]|uniref:Uncharacterized protein n=1 Tax=Pleurodeles waltl TaxID=8319 RepID=A0AAV7T4H0_PLEWA|nr:hypothetical protein NDU88_002820 [Pleurodeles waltl]